MLEMSKKKRIFYLVFCTILLVVYIERIMHSYTNGYPIGAMVILSIGMLVAIAMLLIK